MCSLAAVALFAGCKKEDGGDSLDIVLSTNTLNFPSEKTTLSVDVTAGREWRVEYSFPDGEEAWVSIDPEKAKGNQTVNITCQANSGYDRSVQIKFTNKLRNTTLTVNQAGEKGPQGANIVYHNDFDKTKAEKNDKGYYPYLDQTDAWRNETGTGISTVAYASSGVSVRTSTSSSDENKSLYGGSGVNNIFFGTENGYFKIEKISLPQDNQNYTISFGGIRSVSDAAEGGSIFDENQFSAYISNDGKKWVKLALTYAAGSAPDGKWDKISSTVTLPANTAELYLYFTTTEKSTYRLDDVDLSLSETSGTAVDFTTGIEFEEEEEEEAPSGTPSGEGTEASPYNVAKAYQVASALEDGKTTATEVYVSGVVSKVDEYFDKYKSVTYYISDEGQKGSFMVYSGKFVGGADFTSMDQIAVGDKVLIRGILKNYKGTFEFDKNNIIVTLNGKGAEDIKSFGVSRTAISVLASETSAIFNVTGNVDWTVTSDNAKFTVSPAKGNGAAAVTVTFPANADTENAVTANIKVSTTDEVSTKDYIVVITQAKANAGGSETVLYSEDFGEPSGNTDLAKFEGWSSSLICPTSEKWRVGTAEACALEGSSGKGNAYSGSDATEILFDFEDKLAGYKSVKLAFNYRKGSGKNKAVTLKCQLSKDGGKTWGDDIIPGNTAGSGWYSVSYEVLDEYMADFCIKFTSTASGTTSRVDDLKLTGIAK